MTSSTTVERTAISIERADNHAAILFASGPEAIAIRAGTVIHIDGKTHAFERDTSLAVSGTLVPGYDYGVGINELGKPYIDIFAARNPVETPYFSGFHFAPGGNATGTEGGNTIASINPYSIWDAAFRPICADPRGMTLVELLGGRRFWADIYLLGADHAKFGTSRCGVTIADGVDLPERPNGGRYKKFDFATASEIYAHHGKRLLGAEEFFAAAYGVKERCARGSEPVRTGAMKDGAERFISQRGLFDVTGTMWQWGTDGHPDDPRPSVFGGSWIDSSGAGSRCAALVYWPGDSVEVISARGGSDHLSPV